MLDYKILIVTDPRQNEGNIYIARLYPNMAVFDHSPAEDFDCQQKVVGSIREILGQTMMREVTLI